jgi:8-oxo-dGTP pyrophosphatase MutT (NUDIX family)
VLRRIHGLLLRVYARLPVQGRRFIVRTIAPGYTVGAMCFIEREDGALLLLRLAYRKRWGVPGGLLKRGEDPGVACRREVMEEVGLDISLVGEPAVQVDAAARRIDIIYRAKPIASVGADEAEPMSPEIVEVRWFPAGQLPELQFETSGALVCLARAQNLTPSFDHH